MPEVRWRLDAAWRGTAYCGWQIQPNGPSVQAAFEKAAAHIFGVSVPVQAAGRTDAGVHAAHQVLGVTTPREIEPKVLQRALNALLPDDISVLSAQIMPESFHPRRWGYRKWYRYRWLLRDAGSPFLRPYVWHVSRRVNTALMSEAAAYFEGTHDMQSFRASGCSSRTTIRTIESASFCLKEDGVAHLDVYGNGFLRHQIRIMAGTLLEVGFERRRPDSIAVTLQARDRQKAGQTAPAKGLILMQSYCHEKEPDK